MSVSQQRAQVKPNQKTFFDEGMPYNQARKRFRQLMLQHHPNKGGNVNMFKKVKDQYDQYILRHNLETSYNKGLKLLETKPSKQMPLERILNDGSTMVIVSLLLSSRENLPTYKFEMLRLKQLSYAKMYGIKSHTRRMSSILSDIESLGGKGWKGKWTFKSVLQQLIGVKKDAIIPALQKKLARIDRIIKNVNRVKPTFILRVKGQEILIDRVYLDALLADLHTMKLATETALFDAKKALKKQTNRSMAKMVEDGQTAANDLMKWWETTKRNASTSAYSRLLLTTGPIQYMIQSLPGALAENMSGQQFILPYGQQGSMYTANVKQPSVLNTAYSYATGMTSLIALGLLHRIRRRVGA